MTDTANSYLLTTGFPLSCLQKYQDPQNVFPGLNCNPAMLNYRRTAVTYSVYTV